MPGSQTTHRWSLLPLLLVSASAMAQDMLVEPYLQSATPQDIWVLWETSTGESTLVEWGTTQNLGTSTEGDSFESGDGGLIHEVHLEGLDPATRYYYQVVTGSLRSDVLQLTTPPEASAESAFQIVAMSDMQKDSSNPDKYREIVEDGIIAYLNQEYGPDLDEHLAMVLLPGDLVDNGWMMDQWRDDFFAPGSALMGYVPFYPVYGNHEAYTPYFTDYFHLPENGSQDYPEHWWYTDYGNLRVLGLDSNTLYWLQSQLDWLDETLDDACSDDDIDFVFAQLHHPYHSELWPPGEIDFTEEVILRMETFSTTCGKPSIHFFGHTHAYSRGQSMDHAHLWVNVATAGGNIDYWGEYDQIDYDEFTVSQDDWGFVLVEVTAGADPSFRLLRISNGNEYLSRDNQVRDDITIRRRNTPPATPAPLSPSGIDLSPDCIALSATGFCDPDDDLHGASQWQISTSCDHFSDPVYESWKQHENWYFDQDTQAGDILTNEGVDGLEENTDYCWRVRYRDRSLAWSDWSEPMAFTTGESGLTDNLLMNPGAEDGTDAWEIVEGYLESLEDGECGGTAPHTGQRYFAVGGICESAAYGEAMQIVHISGYATEIDAGQVLAWFEGYLADWNGSDEPALLLRFLDGQGDLLSESEPLTAFSDQWTMLSQALQVPPLTRSIAVVMQGTRNSGTDNDSYIDDISLRLDTTGTSPDCEAQVGEADPVEDCEPPETTDTGSASESDSGSCSESGCGTCDTADCGDQPEGDQGCSGCSTADPVSGWGYLGLLALAGSSMLRRERP